MTIERSDVVLRATEPHLWVARRGDYPAGTIEQGRRFAALDVEGDVVARCTTLQGACAALASDRPRCRALCRRRMRRLVRWSGLVAACSAPAAVLGGALTLALPH